MNNRPYLIDANAPLPKAFVAYLRVSTQRQGDSGLGLEAQRESIRRYVDTLGSIRMVREFTEVESGRKNDRPQMAEAIKLCRASGATLLVSRLDRLTRDIGFLKQLQDAGVDFIVAEFPEANQFTIGILALVAEHESRMISERTKAAMGAAKARGKVFGNPNLVNNTGVRNTCTQAARAARAKNAVRRKLDTAWIVREMEAERGEKLTLQEAADALNEAGYTTPRGKQFNPTAVRRALQAELSFG